MEWIRFKNGNVNVSENIYNICVTSIINFKCYLQQYFYSLAEGTARATSVAKCFHDHCDNQIIPMADEGKGKAINQSSVVMKIFLFAQF